MLPQCDPTILQQNPRFKILHEHLTTEILKPDGSTRSLETDPARIRVQTELKTLQLRATKRRILKRIVCRLPYDLKNGLPDELRDLVAIIALYLEQYTPNDGSNGASDDDDTLSLLGPDINAFKSQFRSLLPAIRDKLTSDLSHLKVLLDAPSSGKHDQSRIPQHTRPESRFRPPAPKSGSVGRQPLLPIQLRNRIRDLRTLQSVDLPAAQRKLAVTGAEVIAAHTLVMERMIHILERTKYGSLSRAGKARAEYLAAVAEGLDGKVNIMHRDIFASIYTPETINALQNYRKHLHDTRVRLKEREKAALKELEVYESADSWRAEGRTGAMVEIARRYGSLGKEVEAVKTEIRRLGGNM